MIDVRRGIVKEHKLGYCHIHNLMSEILAIGYCYLPGWLGDVLDIIFKMEKTNWLKQIDDYNIKSKELSQVYIWTIIFKSQFEYKYSCGLCIPKCRLDAVFTSLTM